MAYTDDLIPIYAQNDVTAIQADPALIQAAFGAPLDELTKRPGFKEAQYFVEEIKRDIEARKDGLSTPDTKAQIAECLRILLQLAMYDKSPRSTTVLKLDTMRALLVQMFAKRPGAGWSATQVVHFDFVFERLKKWNTYFLSYTNEGGKVVNNRYSSVIDLYVDPDVRKQRDWDRDNLLADAIVNCLRSRLLRRGFYDKDKIKVGTPLEPVITPAAGETFAFIQLVQRQTFDVLKTVNWCYEEYRVFLLHNQGELAQWPAYKEPYDYRFSAILTADNPKSLLPPFPPYQYEPWRNQIFDQKHYLPLPVDIDKFDQAMDEVASQIVNLKYKIIESVPS